MSTAAQYSASSETCARRGAERDVVEVSVSDFDFDRRLASAFADASADAARRVRAGTTSARRDLKWGFASRRSRRARTSKTRHAGLQEVGAGVDVGGGSEDESAELEHFIHVRVVADEEEVSPSAARPT